MKQRPTPTPALRKEERKALEAFRTGRQTLADAPEFLFRLARQHNVAASLAAIASERGQYVPQIWRHRLRQLRAQQLTVRPHLDRLARRLNRLGRPWFAARGWARIYDPVLPVRPMGDLDIYMTLEHLEDLDQVIDGDWRHDPRNGRDGLATRKFIDSSGILPPLDGHGALSWFGSADPVSMHRYLSRRRQIDGCWLASPEDDFAIALAEALVDSSQRSLRRIWELQGLAERLDEDVLKQVYTNMDLKPVAWRQIESRLGHPGWRRPAVMRAAWNWLRASRSPLRTALRLSPMMLRLLGAKIGRKSSGNRS